MTKISLGYQNPLKARFAEEFFREVPSQPGVYFFLDEEGDILYVGKSDCLRKRLRSYSTAKPGLVPEHTLEMLELTARVRWELASSGASALAREADLIRLLRPPFNIAGTEPLAYVYIGMRTRTTKRAEFRVVDFRVSRQVLSEEFVTYGCFRHRGKAKAGYTALLRLLFVASCERDRVHLPARVCRASPPYLYQAIVREEFCRPLDRFFRGTSDALLRQLTERLLAQENVAPYLYAPLQRDLRVAHEFYRVCAGETRRIARRAGIRHGPLTQELMDQELARIVRAPLSTEPFTLTTFAKNE